MPLAQAPIASPFGARSVAGDAVKGVNLAGKTAIVTGGASGLGIETVRALAAAGARVVMPVRSVEKAERIALDLRRATDNPNIQVAYLDLENFESVHAFADVFLASRQPLHLLINNAGIMACPERRIDAGIESQFGTNHLGHMILTCRLVPALLYAQRARVVCLSSIGHRRSAINFEDPNFEKRPYDKWEAYGQSKTANSLFAVELNRRLEPRGVSAFAVHPGGIMTDLQRDMSKEEIRAFGWVDENGKVNERFKSPAGGAATAVWCATSELLSEGGGVYCEDCNIAAAVGADDQSFAGVRPWAINPNAAKLLWDLSESMLDERFAI